MMLDWFNARDAANVGIALADQFAPGAASRSTTQSAKVGKEHAFAMQELLRRADRDVRALRLNFYKKARFAISFKWRLIANGIEPTVADEVTQSLISHLSQDSAGAAAARDAAAARVDSPDSGTVQQLLEQGRKSLVDGDYATAVRLFQEVAALVPRQPPVLNDLGVALSRLGRYEDAERYYREAIEIDPAFAAALYNLATLLQANPQQAEEFLRRALRANPEFSQARAKLGMSLAFTGRQHEAKACFEKALEIEPTNQDALLGLAEIARTDGRFDEAEMFIQRTLKNNPRCATAWAALTGIRKMTSADGDWLQKAEEIAGSGVSLWEEAELRFAMGKYCDGIDDFELAFRNYRRANELLRSVAGKYTREAHSQFADDMIRGHTRQAMAALGGGGSASTKPIFVVGMPRSGTSLAEQIIASHPQAKGAGELPFWLDASCAHAGEIRQGILNEPARKKLSEEYLRVLAHQCPDAPRVVDKSPVNSDYLGFIHSVFPKARIIRMRRDPIDTCLSCYFQHFSTAMRFTMDLSDLADYYRVHQRLMQHWCDALPAGTILEVPYEQLVADQEVWTRRILDFLELEWDERCLSFHETQRTVNTSSAWQVRQKIYTKSVGRWRNYEKFIGPLKGLRD